MNLDLNKDLVIRVKDFNSIANDLELIKSLRKLTLNHFSGMNYELSNFEKLSKTREVKCKIILAYVKDQLAGWAILSREPSDYYFHKSPKGYDPLHGVLFQVYISYIYRRRGIGSELLKVARRKAGPYKLCFCPWDGVSNKFYNKFKHYKHKTL